MYEPDQLLHLVKITVAGIEPPIWRRLLLPQDLNFAQLHEVIQAAFGWTDSHLHQFVVGGLIVGAPDLDEDGLCDRQTFEASRVFLRHLEFMNWPDPRILYEYDFGDGWRHWIEFETEVQVAANETYPRLIAGARRGPPEDVGGPRGYADFLEAWADADHDDHRAVRTWVGRASRPETFDHEKTQKAIQRRAQEMRKGLSVQGAIRSVTGALHSTRLSPIKRTGHI